MANKVGGLRPIQATSPRPSYDRGQRPIDTEEPRPVQLRPAAAPVNRYAPPPAPPQDTRLKQLADALSSLNPVLQEWGSRRHEQKTNEQRLKIPAYLEQIKRDWKGGKIDAVQVGELFPETVPTIRMAIAEAYGERSGTDAFSKVIEAVNNNEELRFDTDKRKAFIEGERKRLFAEIGGDNDFYSSGFVSAFDKQVASWDLGWQRQTADKHMEVLGDKFNEEAFNAFMNGGADALLQVDATWDKTGGLHRTTRNKIVVDRITQEAYDRGDSSLLDRLPARFLNSETKVALSKGKAQIEHKMRSDWSFGKQLEDHNRQEQTRQGMIQIYRDAASGKQIDLRQYIENPELMRVADDVRTRNFHTTPQASAARKTQIIQGIVLGSTFGDVRHLGINRGDFTFEGLSNAIMSDKVLTTQDTTEILDSLPKLMQGSVVMNDPVVKYVYDTIIKPQLDVADGSVIARMNKALGGTTSVHVKANEMFQKGVYNQAQADFAKTGEWPKHHRLNEIAQQAGRETNAWLLYYTDIANVEAVRAQTEKEKAERAATASPANPASAPSTPPATNTSKTLPPPVKSQPTPQQSEMLRRRMNVQRPNL